MMKHWPFFVVSAVLTVGALNSRAGTLFYQAIPAAQSDANCGISTDNQYTSAVDGGNTRGTDRVINGITLFALVANGESSTADNCTLNALSGSLTNGGGAVGNINADGVFKEVLSDLTFNNSAGDNSQQEIVLDPDSLEEGATYDLRVYICNSAGQNRLVSLAFVGDGQAAAETGFFNEDDARTSAGGFTDPNQVYYINYRFTWDGDSTPGITITQKTGAVPFVLFALTNQLVPGGGGAAAATGESAGGEAAGGEAAGGGAAAGAGAAGGGGGLGAGMVSQESDEVGVSSDDFYNSDSLNNNGRWIKLSKWGTCWQPTNVPEGWCPYTNGSFQECDDCGWTFVSDEPWAWCTYHYGRWCKVRTGCGWAWVPGKVWASSWVSWRRGRDESCNCIGWAPLPPEAGCEFGVGISSWVDHTCDIGPDCYTFINIRDFGSDSYWGCGCIYEHSRNSTLIIDTFNCTNISLTKWGTYCGGPDYNWCNTQIRKLGGKECGKVYVNRYDDPGKMGGKYSKREGNQLGLMSPHIKGERNPKHAPKVAESLGSDKIDKGWGNVKDKNVEKNLRNHIAEESKGKNPKNTKASLPSDVAQTLSKRHGGETGLAGGAGAGGGQHPGGKGKKGAGAGAGAGAQALTAGGQPGGAQFNQHPGKGKKQGQGPQGAGAGAAGGTAGAGGGGQHPGKGRKGEKAAGGVSGAGAGTQTAAAGGGGGGGGKGRHPGQSLKKQGAGTAGAGAAGTGAAGATAGGGGGGQHPGKHNKGQGAQGAGAAGAGTAGAGATGATAGGGGGGQHPGKHNKGQGAQGAGTAGAGTAGTGAAGAGAGGGGGGQHPGKHKGKQAAGAGAAAQGAATTQGGTTGQTGQGGAGQGGGGGGKGHRKQQLQGQTVQGAQGAQGTTGAGTATGGQTGGGKVRRKQQQQQQQYQQQPTNYGQGAAGGGGGGGGGRRKQQQLQQQQYPQQQQQQQGSGKGKKAKPTPTPY